MQESLPYRQELAAYAEQFARRRVRQIWRDASLEKAERALFVGFLFVRKLIECKKVTDKCAQSSTEVGRAPVKRLREVSDFQRDDLFKDLVSVEWLMGKVDVHQLADKVIHSWWIVPMRDEARGLAGYVFTTDRKRNAELWFLPLDSVVDVFKRFSAGAIDSLHAKRDRDGRLLYWKAT